MATEEVENFLAHFGVLGMKWGRRKPESVRRESESSYPGVHPDHLERISITRKPTHTLSTAELKKANDRLNTELQYNRLKPTKVNKGKKIVAGVIAAGTAGATLYKLSNGKAGQALIAAGKKIVGSKVLLATMESTLPKLLV